MKVPRVLDIFWPSTVKKPCAKIPVGVLKPLPCRMAGQNRA